METPSPAPDEQSAVPPSDLALADLCAERVGCPLKISREAFAARLTPLLVLAERKRRRRAAIDAKRKAAKRFLAEIRKAEEAGLAAALGHGRDGIKERLAEIARGKASQGDWVKFIAGELAKTYIHAFREKPGRSVGVDRDGRPIVGGPFLRFVSFVVSNDFGRTLESKRGEKGLTASTLDDYIKTSLPAINRAWLRHQNRMGFLDSE